MIKNKIDNELKNIISNRIVFFKELKVNKKQNIFFEFNTLEFIENSRWVYAQVYVNSKKLFLSDGSYISGDFKLSLPKNGFLRNMVNMGYNSYDSIIQSGYREIELIKVNDRLFSMNLIERRGELK